MERDKTLFLLGLSAAPALLLANSWSGVLVLWSAWAAAIFLQNGFQKLLRASRFARSPVGVFFVLLLSLGMAFLFEYFFPVWTAAWHHFFVILVMHPLLLLREGLGRDRLKLFAGLSLLLFAGYAGKSALPELADNAGLLLILLGFVLAGVKALWRGKARAL